MKPLFNTAQQGFSITKLMAIVAGIIGMLVVIIGVLVVIMFPSYREYVFRIMFTEIVTYIKASSLEESYSDLCDIPETTFFRGNFVKKVTVSKSPPKGYCEIKFSMDETLLTFSILDFFHKTKPSCFPDCYIKLIHLRPEDASSDRQVFENCEGQVWMTETNINWPGHPDFSKGKPTCFGEQRQTTS